MESGYHIVTIRVNKISWAHVWRLRPHYIGTGYDKTGAETIAMAQDSKAEDSEDTKEKK
jgi:hypothetical protein